MFPILFVQLLHQAATEMVSVQPYGPLMCQLLHQAATDMVSVQPYGPLMCKRLAQILTNKTDPVNFDPEHLTCQVDVPEWPAEVKTFLEDSALGIRMRCVMCTEIPGASVSEQVCQTVNSHTVCSLITNNRSCVFTDNIDRMDNDKKVINWTEWRRLGPPCGKQLKDRVSAGLLHTGDMVVIYMCKIQTDKKKESKVKEAALTTRQETGYRRERVECSRDFCPVNRRCTRGDKTGERYVTGRESINCYTGDGHVTGIATLAQIGRSELFLQLLGLGADISIQMKTSILTRTAMQNIINPVKYLVEIGLDIEVIGLNGVTPFLMAAMAGSVDVLDYLESVGCNVNPVTDDGMNAFHHAAEHGHIEIIEHVLKMNCSFDLLTKTPDGYLPIAYAMSYQNASVVAKIKKIMESEYNTEFKFE